ncbi:PfkB family carbohydrate kinase [Streptomyces sp. NPDC090022]|uniref:PfkB family carbohydrate kinase n=1 Tax=Streptomyces sp. NPDC090022 TaxID=3365920 RepID=UPI00381609D5
MTTPPAPVPRPAAAPVAPAPVAPTPAAPTPLAPAYDVLVLGEVLVEIHADAALRDAADGTAARIAYSGDALNAAAAAVAAGARTALLAVVGDDELSVPLLERAAGLGVDITHVHRAPRPNGAYLLCADTRGEREFVYWRAHSAGSTLSPDHIASWHHLLTRSTALITSGITGALSPSSRDAVVAAAEAVHRAGGHLSYDLNFRPRLTDRAAARALLARIAPLAGLLKTSCPADALALVGTADPRAAADRCRRLGARAVAVTTGADALLLHDGATVTSLPVPANPAPVDATGAGDCFMGTTTARLALGDSLGDAVAYGMAAASLSVGARGGTGHVPAFTATSALATAHRTATVPGP